MYTVRESHLLLYVRLPRVADQPAEEMNVDSSAAAGPSSLAAAWTATSKSFNPHPMDTHVSFAVLDLALHPSGKIIACLTGDHRGGAGERVLLYGTEPDEVSRRLVFTVEIRADPPADGALRLSLDQWGQRRFCTPAHGMAAGRNGSDVSIRTPQREIHSADGMVEQPPQTATSTSSPCKARYGHLSRCTARPQPCSARRQARS